MTQIIQLTIETQKKWQNALKEFERQFIYPLSDGQTFTISHGDDYSSFFRSMGQDIVLAATKNNQIIGIIACALKTIKVQGQLRRAAYIGDVKMDKSFANPFTLFRLFKTLEEKMLGKAEIGYGIVMEGTTVLPYQYTGKMGIPLFEKRRELYIIRLNSKEGVVESSGVGEYKLYESLCVDDPISISNSFGRSLMEPRWFNEQNKAVCLMEDTRQAKRLFLSSGQELVSAHLSFIAFKDAECAQKMIQDARVVAFTLGIPGVFMAITSAQYRALESFLKREEAQITKGMIYGTSPLLSSSTFNTAEV